MRSKLGPKVQSLHSTGQDLHIRVGCDGIVYPQRSKPLQPRPHGSGWTLNAVCFSQTQRPDLAPQDRRRDCRWTRVEACTVSTGSRKRVITEVSCSRFQVLERLLVMFRSTMHQIEVPTRTTVARNQVVWERTGRRVSPWAGACRPTLAPPGCNGESVGRRSAPRLAVSSLLPCGTAQPLCCNVKTHHQEHSAPQRLVALIAVVGHRGTEVS